MKAVNLETEHMKNPIGIDSRQPYFTWNCEGGKRQTAYEIEAVCNKEKIWNSGKRETDCMCAVFEAEVKSRQRIYWKVRLWDEEGKVGEWSREAFFEMGLLKEQDFMAKWICPELECDPLAHKPASYLKKKFNAPKGECARLYITAHGLYEAWLNGRRVGNFVLAPGCTNYEKKLVYQTYDVTDDLLDGENEIQVIVGDGWYRSVSGVDGDRNLYGEEIALFAQLEVDGKVVCKTEESWLASQNGPIRENDMQQGEIVDARMEAGMQFHQVKVENYGVKNLVGTNSLPICEMERFEGKIFTTPNGERVIDFGQNLAGYVEFKVTAHEGDTLELIHGETLDENGNFTQENFQDRKRHKEGGTKQRVRFICKEGENTYKSKFTIWGFRYAKIETEIDLQDAEFISIAVYSKMKQLGKFECGNDAVNRLVKNIIWSQKSNFCDVPTDCPTRERAAWTGDMGVFAHTGLYLMDCYPVIRKWLEECRFAQFEDGRIANIAPKNNRAGFFSNLLAGSVGWGDACILVPYELYKRYGDIRILEENYEMMKKWYAYLENRAKKRPLNPVRRWKRNPYRRYTIETGIDYGEWCEPDVESTSAMRTPQEKIATAYFAYSGKRLSEIAEILGKKEDAKRIAEVAEKAKKAYRFLATENGKINSDRQADYVRALAFELLDESERGKTAKRLNELVVQSGYHLNTGFLSTPDLCRVLADYGYLETAYKLLLQDTMPSWLYEVKKGATTVWENWDGINENGEVKASHNHYSYGAVAGWLFDGVCGIHVENRIITIAPKPCELLKYADATYLSPYGEIKSAWRYEKNQIIFEISVPANTSAFLLLPDGSRRKIEGEENKRITIEANQTLFNSNIPTG